jgi:hypothetical protein
MSNPNVYKVELTSVPDRDDLVVEIWVGDEQLAELRNEPSGVCVQLYPGAAGAPWDLSHDDFMAALKEARERLGPARPENEQERE